MTDHKAGTGENSRFPTSAGHASPSAPLRRGFFLSLSQPINAAKFACNANGPQNVHHGGSGETQPGARAAWAVEQQKLWSVQSVRSLKIHLDIEGHLISTNPRQIRKFCWTYRARTRGRA